MKDSSKIFMEIVRKRRSIRSYTDEDVPEEIIKELLKAAFFSPSSKNLRPWHFVIVKDKKLKQKLSKTTPWSKPIEKAPVVIVILAEELSEKWIEDCSVAAEHIQLAATAFGLGACWIQVRGNKHNHEPAEIYVKKLLKIPDNFRVECMISIGYPAERKSSHSDDEVRWDRVYFEEFGNVWIKE